MEEITKQNISNYLQTEYKIEDPNQIFDPETPNEKRNEIINNLFHHFTGHRIDVECNVLMAQNNIYGDIRTYYFCYDRYSHLHSIDNLMTELKAAQKVYLSIQDFHQKVMEHRIESNRRFELIQNIALSKPNLEYEH